MMESGHVSEWISDMDTFFYFCGWGMNTTSKEVVISKLTGCPDSKVHGANMGPIWGRQDPDGPHVGPMKFDIWVVS